MTCQYPIGWIQRKRLLLLRFPPKTDFDSFTHCSLLKNPSSSFFILHFVPISWSGSISFSFSLFTDVCVFVFVQILAYASNFNFYNFYFYFYWFTTLLSILGWYAFVFIYVAYTHTLLIETAFGVRHWNVTDTCDYIKLC